MIIKKKKKKEEAEEQVLINNPSNQEDLQYVPSWVRETISKRQIGMQRNSRRKLKNHVDAIKQKIEREEN